jgi:hypothetical protein
MEVELRDMYVQEEQERLGKRKRKEVADNTLELIAVMENSTDEEFSDDEETPRIRNAEDDARYHENDSNIQE